MEIGNRTGRLPGFLLGMVGVFAVVAGIMSRGPDLVGGIVFGGVALAAAAVILSRRTPPASGSDQHVDA